MTERKRCSQIVGLILNFLFKIFLLERQSTSKKAVFPLSKKL